MVAPHLVDRLRAIKASRLAAEDRVVLPPGEGPKLLTLEVLSSLAEACLESVGCCNVQFPTLASMHKQPASQQGSCISPCQHLLAC